MTAQYVIGIDLGTTNSVLAYAPINAEKPQVELLAVPQLTHYLLDGFLWRRASNPRLHHLLRANDSSAAPTA